MKKKKELGFQFDGTTATMKIVFPNGGGTVHLKMLLLEVSMDEQIDDFDPTKPWPKIGSVLPKASPSYGVIKFKAKLLGQVKVGP